MGTTNFDQLALGTPLPASQVAAQGVDTLRADLAGAQTTGTKKQFWICPIAGTIVDIRAHLDTAPVGSSFIVDIMKNGVTVFTTTANRPTILAAAQDSSHVLPDVVSVAVGDILRLDIIQVGSGTAGSDLAVAISVKRALQ